MTIVILLLLLPFLVGFCPITLDCLNDDPLAWEQFDRATSPDPSNSIPWGHPYMVDPPKIYDETGTYRGEYSPNPYGLDSISNPYGKYGSPYSPDSLNNPYRLPPLKPVEPWP